ncbi:MAG: hypothetical protein WKF35_02720 [Ferruginibacter sp.]
MKDYINKKTLSCGVITSGFIIEESILKSCSVTLSNGRNSFTAVIIVTHSMG